MGILKLRLAEQIIVVSTPLWSVIFIVTWFVPNNYFAEEQVGPSVRGSVGLTGSARKRSLWATKPQ